MIKKFIKFAWNVLNNESGQLGWLKPAAEIGLPLLGGLFGGWAGSQQAGPQTQYQTVQYLPPQYTPQQQAINNLMYWGALQNLGQQNPEYMDLLNQYIYGTPATTTQPATQAGDQTEAQSIIQEYQRQQEAGREQQKQYEQTREDIITESLKPYYDFAKKHYEEGGTQRDLEYAIFDPKSEYRKALDSATKQISEITGLSRYEAQSYAVAINRKLSEEYTGRKAEVTVGERRNAQKNRLFINLMDDPEGSGFSDIYSNLEQSYKVSTGEIPTEETPEGEVPTTPEGEVPTTGMPEGGILGELMMTPEKIAEQFGLIRERGMEDISNWYQQAARELEQRGIAGYGGLMGSQYERDVGGLLGRRGEMQTTLGRELGVAQTAAETQNWYDMLQALGNLQTMQSNIQAQRLSPWLGAAQQMTNVPYPYTTTTTTSGTQGPGWIPGAIGGAYAGAGLANYLGNWGQGGGTTTSPLTGQYTYRNIPQNV